MLLSKSCVYGLRASLYLSSMESNGYVPIRKMSDKLGISFHFLTKVLQQLTASEILESYKGPNGGVRLQRSGDSVTLMEVVKAIDGDYILTECALGLPGCGIMKPCPLHEKWAETRDGIKKMLEETTLTELSEKGKKMDLRITEEGGFEDWIENS